MRVHRRGVSQPQKKCAIMEKDLNLNGRENNNQGMKRKQNKKDNSRHGD